MPYRISSSMLSGNSAFPHLEHLLRLLISKSPFKDYFHYNPKRILRQPVIHRYLIDFRAKYFP